MVAGRMLTGNFIFVITLVFENIALHPLWIQGWIADRLSAPRNAENEPVGQHLDGRGRKVPEKAKLGIPYIRQKLIFGNAVDPVYILKVFLKNIF